MIEIIFDVETQKFFDDIGERDPSRLGVSVVSVYRREINSDLEEIDGEMKSFWDEQAGLKPIIDKMWPLFEGADRIIGFNSLGFDVPVLEPYYGKNFGKLPHFDILAEIKEVFGRRISLDAVAKETLELEMAKIASGDMGVKWWVMKDKDSLEKLRKYCEMDVLITRDVYDVGLKQGKLKFKDHWNELREVKVDFSYLDKEEKKEVQMGLF